MNILITGASGFLGSALALRLKAAGHDVSLLLRPGSSLRRLGPASDGWRIGRCQGDAEIIDFVAGTQPDVLIHTACAYGRAGESLAGLVDANLRLGVVLLQALARVPRADAVTFLDAGTCLAPEVSPYALSKHQFAAWGQMLASAPDSRLQFIHLRLQHMHGPGDDRSKFLTHVLHACRSHQPELALTAGEQRRDFVYIDDVLSACQTLLARRADLARFEHVDVGTGVAPTLRSVVETIHRLTASRTRLVFGALPYRAHEAMLCCADISRLQSLGWQPAFDLLAGLQRTIELESPS
jgi:nucleoside-diphosphate-sugar epimerase